MSAAICGTSSGQAVTSSPPSTMRLGLMSRTAIAQAWATARLASARAETASGAWASSMRRRSSRSAAPAISVTAGAEARVSRQPFLPHWQGRCPPGTVMCPSSPAYPVLPPPMRSATMTQAPTPPPRWT